MAINTTLVGLSTTASANGPDGATDSPATIDDAIRYALAFTAELRNRSDPSEAVWTNDTATPTAGTGSFTSVNANRRYVKIGKIVHISIQINIPTNGTAAGHVSIPLPYTAAASIPYVLAGRERALTGATITGQILASGTTAQIYKYDNTYPGGTGAVLTLTGIYEEA